MEDTVHAVKKQILSILSELSESGMKEKILRKEVLKNMEENDRPKKSIISDCLAQLVEAGKLKCIDGEYSNCIDDITKKKSKKRKLNQEKTTVDNQEDTNDIIAAPADTHDTTAGTDNNDGEGQSKRKTVMSELWKYGEVAWRDGVLGPEYLQRNPDRITRLFCGNLNKKITEEQLKNAIPGITHIKWITDKVTQEFYGSTFLEVRDPESAAAAVLMDKAKLLGRPLKIYYCPPRPGDVWPPLEPSKHKPNGSTNPAGGGASVGSGGSTRGQSVKPVDCKKLYCGNLSYDIDDDTMCAFFQECGEVVGLRWLTHKDTGDFRGCGFIQFATSEAADKAMALNGKEIMGRPIRLDWTE